MHGDCKPCHVVGMAMGIGMEADFSQSKTEARARRDFPTLQPAEGIRSHIFIPKDPGVDLVISRQRITTCWKGTIILKIHFSSIVNSILLLSCEVPKSPRAQKQRKNTQAQLPAGPCGVCVSTLGAISSCLVSEFLPLFGWALHKPLGESRSFFRKWNI